MAGADAAPRRAARSAGPAEGEAPRLGAAMVALLALELLARATGVEALRGATWVVMGLVVVGARRALGLREAYLLSLCAALAAAIAVRDPEPGATFALALGQASFLMAFILLVGLLHEAAATSPSVEACGRYLTEQPPGRQYYTLYTGTGLLAVLFNLGIVSFLVPLVQRGLRAAAAPGADASARERRPVSALLRGFAWSVIWSPTAVAPLAVAELIPGADRLAWIGIGLAIFVAVMLAGATEDRLRLAGAPAGPAAAGAPFPRPAALHLLAACLWLAGITLAVVRATGESLVFGLMAACPAMLVGWIAVQRAGDARATLARLERVASVRLPAAAPLAVTLACSGFVGRAAAALLSGPDIAAALRLDAMPDFALLSAIPPALCLLSFLGFSPIMTAVFFGSLFGGLPVLPADPTLIALSISCGWALSMTLSPFATVVLLINRVSGIRVRDLTWRWNLAFSLLAASLLVPIFALLTGGR